ncbi:Dyp-type peroxidase [Paracraurococcus lichenis]|uniref:Peroxidase n=1 Tax=Paracraurococcus lichenis TaxID=3064888 RepID=A0ABT9E8U1_9PROT|nr:hypothetical protein [Paracraurococcus sp. LOR1-02]MDO9712618.1 hypothetical protein [Paracraurococcus sp. LOR1-02]
MSELDLHDIQGNITRPYGRYGFPYARYFLFHIEEGEGDAGRWFVDQLRAYVTTAEPWKSSKTENRPGVTKVKPLVTVNVAFTYAGLCALDLPTATLRGMPDEFIEGMACRKHILGDLHGSDPAEWDPVWRDANLPHGRRTHIWVALNAQAKEIEGTPVDELEVWTTWLKALTENPHAKDKVLLLKGHGRDGQGEWQDSCTRMVRDPVTGRPMPTPDEHFGFMDGIGDPVFTGQYEEKEEAVEVIGDGKLMPGPYGQASWKPLAAGEFLFGYPSEGQEESMASVPYQFMRNGTFMALRKLHQNTGTFHRQMRDYAALYRRVANLASEEEALETLKAKMVGRWRSGVPLTVAPTYREMLDILKDYPMMLKRQKGEVLQGPAEWLAYKAELARIDGTAVLRNFRYTDDPQGRKCPLGAHMRRANPRDMLDPQPDRDAKGQVTSSTSTLVNRRRILRRGLPYGECSERDEDEHGVFIMALCTSLFRQFEFIQQQWVQYGLDFESGNDTCPIVGNRDQAAKFVIPADGTNGAMPFVAQDMQQYVVVRGGDYFFIPSMNALRMIATGEIDPT